MCNDSKDSNSILPCEWEQGVTELSPGGGPTEVTSQKQITVLGAGRSAPWHSQAWCKKTSLISRTEMFSWKILDYTGAGCSHLAPSRRPILCLKPTKISAIPVVWTPRALGTPHPRLRQHCSATLKSALSLCTVITSSQNLPYQQPTARSKTSFKNQLIFHKLLNASGALKRFD